MAEAAVDGERQPIGTKGQEQKPGQQQQKEKRAQCTRDQQEGLYWTAQKATQCT